MTAVDFPARDRGRVAVPAQFQKRRDPPVPGNSFARFITAHAKSYVYHEPAIEIARELWPHDQVTNFLLTQRAATAPAQTRVPGWAQELAQRAVADVVTALGPVSAGIKLLQCGLVLNFDRTASIIVPGFVTEFSHTGAWVAERQPIPVFQASAAAAILDQHKIAAIAVLTRETIESSNAEALIEDAMTKSLGRVLDEVLFDANPADLSRPAGLRYGVTAATPSTATDSQDAFLEDMSALADSIAPVAGSSRIALIGSWSRATRIAIRFYGAMHENVVILPSSAVINDFLAVACAALVAAFGSEPEIEVSRVAALNMDSAPAADPTTPVGPQRSLWQTDSVAIKLRWPMTWAVRDPRAFAWMTPTKKW